MAYECSKNMGDWLVSAKKNEPPKLNVFHVIISELLHNPFIKTKAQGRLEPATLRMGGGYFIIEPTSSHILTPIEPYHSESQIPIQFSYLTIFFLHGIFRWCRAKKFAHNLSLRLSAESDFMYVPVPVIHHL